MRKIIWNR